MKRLVCLIVSVICIMSFTSCSLFKDKEVQIDYGESNTIESSDFSESYSTANVTIENLEIGFPSEDKYVFKGIEIQEDNGINSKKVRELLQYQIENNNFCSIVGGNLELQFADKIPKSIKWYNHYYIDTCTKNFIYTSLQQNNTVCNIKDTVVLPIGIDLAASIDSSYPQKEYYRMVRIVCEFDDRMIEYYIFLM